MTFAKGDVRNMAFADLTHRQDDADSAFLQSRLVLMPNHAGVHYCGSGITVFVAEIGPDQETHFARQYLSVEPESGLDLDISFFEHFFDLPVPVGKIAQHRREFAPHRGHIETGDVAGEKSGRRYRREEGGKEV